MTSAILGKGQKQQNYFSPGVVPGGKAELVLPGGQPGDGPFYYSLGVQSTVPFVTLEGGGSSQKEFSWGELIEVKEGQQVTVVNSSFMKGDVEIVSGLDYAAKPARISVAIEMEGDPNTPGTIFRSKYPLDVRGCRNAWLMCNMLTGTEEMFFGIRGFSKKHSVNASIDGTVIPVSEYLQTILISPNTAIGQLPLGYGPGLIPGTAMALLDAVEIGFGIPNPVPTIVYPLFMFVLEY